MASSALSVIGSPESPSSDFGFAFNDVNFSDRVLRIEILTDLPGSKPDPGDSIGDWARNRKRRRDDPPSNANGPELLLVVPKFAFNEFNFYDFVV